jgi:putative transposase
MELLSIYGDLFHLKIYHWCIMRTHFHILIEMADPRGISCLMAGISRAYTHYHHKNHGTSGFLWKGRFGLQPIHKEQYLLACGRYIERNPVRAHIVEEASRYPFSSAGFYCLGARDGITREDPTYTRFGLNPIQRRAGYNLFLHDFNTEEESIFKDTMKPAGDRDFTGRLQLINGRLVPHWRGRPRVRISI